MEHDIESFSVDENEALTQQMSNLKRNNAETNNDVYKSHSQRSRKTERSLNHDNEGYVTLRHQPTETENFINHHPCNLTFEAQVDLAPECAVIDDN